MKASAMILDVGEGYIGLGKTIEERENLLRSACSAWNMACAPIDKREDLIEDYMGKYKEYNPDADDEICANLEKDIRLLIKEKERKYPDEKIQMFGSSIVIFDGQDEVTVSSIQME